MRKSPQSECLSIAGPAGSLDCLLDRPGEIEATASVVVCHPHPMHGGTMNNKVVHTLSRAFLGTGMATLRFNFRGVGASEGSFDDGNGEVRDVLAGIAFVKEQFPGRPVWLAGFSFGAAMAIRAAVETKTAGLVSVAPAAFRFAGDLPIQPACPWLIVHGEDDELVPIDESIEWANSLDPGPELVVFPDTTHFFHGKLINLRETVRAFVAKHESGPESA